MNYSKTLRYLFCTVVVLGFSTEAFAQTRTWVSGVGNDANPCSRTAPCKTFAGAISKTSAGGEINAIDPGGFGAVTITKSITIKCEGVLCGVLVSGTNAIIINDSASGTPNTAIVTLSGLDIEGLGTGINGISFASGAVLHVHKTQIRNFRGAGGNGISVTPSTATGGAKKVNVVDSYITDNGGTATNAGLLLKATGGAPVNLTVIRTQFENNTNGIFADNAGGGGGSNITVSESTMINSSGNGIAVSSTSNPLSATVTNCVISVNGAGAAVAGGQGFLRLGGNTISGNGTGVSNSGGTLQSFKNNMIVGNAADGTPINPVSSGGLITN